MNINLKDLKNDNMTPSQVFKEKEKEWKRLINDKSYSVTDHNRSTAIAMLESVKEMVGGMIEDEPNDNIPIEYGLDVVNAKTIIKADIQGHNRALTDLITRLDEEINNLKGL